ncbi:hypothetical protein E2C01_066973 [Portunus trituberculatus]|uniref:Uncharacterized protein n=1 Tax=Portunus trituberculatus TaxID=210409 RepID=A0A5B7HIL3_PORTR|nr:hypothetical protein [Portunus trituberculatus]
MRGETLFYSALVGSEGRTWTRQHCGTHGGPGRHGVAGLALARLICIATKRLLPTTATPARLGRGGEGREERRRKYPMKLRSQSQAVSQIRRRAALYRAAVGGDPRAWLGCC